MEPVYEDEAHRQRTAKEEESGEKVSFFSGPEQKRIFFTVEVV